MLSGVDTEVDPTLQMVASVLGPVGERMAVSTRPLRACTCLHLQAATHMCTCCKLGRLNAN